MNWIKNYILNLSFVKQCVADEIKHAVYEPEIAKLEIIKQSNLKYFQSIDDEAQNKLQELLGNVDYTSVVTFDKNTRSIAVGGIKLEEDKLSNLRSEAEFFLASDLYKILSETKKDLAYKTMFDKSQNFEDLRTGKLILFNISQDKVVINLFKNWQPIARK